MRSMDNKRIELLNLLKGDLDFHDAPSNYASHNFHSFPAKFPPQLPKEFILGLTQPGDIVLDPMAGSGTTILEAYLNKRVGLGFDIDPLAILLSSMKVTELSIRQLEATLIEIVRNSWRFINNGQYGLENLLLNMWDEETEKFIDYWFAKETQYELISLITHIQKVQNPIHRKFLELAFSSIIITKSGGVSLAFDLAHTRPHKAKVAYSTNGNILYGDTNKINKKRSRYQIKKLKSPISEFEKRVNTNIKSLIKTGEYIFQGKIMGGNAQNLPLRDSIIDLIVTSPPYAANAIDYMRAHKFSLVWFGYNISGLSTLRSDYIGGEAINNFIFEPLPANTEYRVSLIQKVDNKKGQVLRRYYSEMTRVLEEMYRVLKPNTAAIVVVGNSILRGKSAEIQDCLAEIGKKVGFEIPHIGIRNLDRNRRMLPTGKQENSRSNIQQRMHEEYIIGFYKN